MVQTPITRRTFIQASTTIGLLSGCIGSSQERRGVFDADDISFNQSSEVNLEFKNRREDKRGFGVEISTKDTMQDSTAIARLDVSVPNVQNSIFLMSVDIAKMDDDTEVDIRLCGQSSCRSVYMGNEYKSRSDGVLATEPGKEFTIDQPFSKLPLSDVTMENPPTNLEEIELRIGDGDIKFTIWSLVFKFQDYSVVSI